MKKIIFLLTTVVFFSPAFAQFRYPPTKTVDSSDTYFGVTYKDPYRWLEYTKEPQVETWFRQQATYTDSVLNNLNGRDELIEEWKQLDKLQPPSINDMVYENGRMFYKKTMPGENIGKIYYREGMNGSEQLLFDPVAYMHGKMPTVQQITPSYDGKKIVIAYTEGGAEKSTLKIMMVDTKQFLKDSIYPSFGVYAWTFDDRAFLYQSSSETKLHRLDNGASSDSDFFSNATYPELNISQDVQPYVVLEEDSKDYIFAGLGSSRPESILYYAPIEQLNSKKISWRPLCTASDSLVRSRAFIDDDVYAISHNNAPNYKVVETSLKHPDWANAVTIAPEKRYWTVRNFIHTKDYLLIVYSDGINNHLSKYSFKNKITSDIKLPYPGQIGIRCINTRTDDCVMYITSWNKPVTEFDYDAATDAFMPGSFNKPRVYPVAYNELQVEETEVKGHDGTMIPLSIIYKKGIRKDGSNVCLLGGYGAYGNRSAPYFDVFKNSLAVRGVVIAIAHVRGGGEKGEAWYKGGFKTTKPNTWKDFISCAEYLISKGYTSQQKLSGEGTSAGGILISRAITARPELFAAAICNVGDANAMRGEFRGPNGRMNIPEFGTVRDSIECKALYEMDGMQHVVNGTRYPAVVCVGGWNDPRVPVSQPGKFAAVLQNASTSGKPVLMKVNYDNGHFIEDKNVTYLNFANMYAFILWQCGHPDFQPKK